MGFFKDLSQDTTPSIDDFDLDQLLGDDVMVDTLDSDDIMNKDEDSEQINQEIMSYLENGGLDNVVIDEEMLAQEGMDDMMVDTLTEDGISGLEGENMENELGVEANELDEIDSIIESLGELPSEDVESVFTEELQEKTIEERLLDDDIDVTPVTPARVASQELSVITKGTVVDGSISASGALEIYGKVNGDVSCLGKLTILGDVTGNAKANEIYINTSRFEGAVNCAGAVKIGVGTVVIGDVTGTGAVIAGAVKGEVDISGPVILDSTAVVKGNIKAKSVQINNGAVLQGFCSLVYSSVDIDDFFDTEEFR